MRLLLVVLLLSLLLALPATAGPITCINTVPSMIDESVPVCSTIPGLGGKLILPSSDFVAWAYFEDLNRRINGTCLSGLPGDCDYNDGRAKITGDYSQSMLTLSFEGGLAAYLNTLSWVGGGVSVSRNSPGPVSATINWVPGSELLLQDITSAGGLWYSGPGDRNVDGAPHVILSMSASAVPEPTTLGLIGGGLIGLGFWGRRQRRKTSA